MASITSERRGVNAKAVFATALAAAQEELVKRLEEAVSARLDANIEEMLGRSAYVRREQIAPFGSLSWVPTGTHHRDAKGRLRPDKKRIKRPIFIALRVWPDTGHAQVLGWRLADSEDTAAWLAFLSELKVMGVRGEDGLELIIHDGGAGLCAALNIVHFGAAEQRCLFHKLRNLYKAIRVTDDTLSRKEQRRVRKAIFRDFHQIWAAKQRSTALRRYLQVVRQYRSSQPDAVRCLQADFRTTIAYFDLHARHPDWKLTHLRTTSRLERFNRSLRRRARAAAAYHSDAALQAILHQEVTAFNAHSCRFQISTKQDT